MRNLLIYLIVIVVATCSIVYSSSVTHTNTKKVYIIDKYIDTVKVTGKNVPNDIYGISFYIVYQEDKTMNRFTELVTKEEYNKAIISTSNILFK